MMRQMENKNKQMVKFSHTVVKREIRDKLSFFRFEKSYHTGLDPVVGWFWAAHNQKSESMVQETKKRKR